MSNYILHLPEHTWNDLAFTEKQPALRKSYSINAPAKRKIIRSTKANKPTK